MYEVDGQGNTRWVSPNEELGFARLLIPRLHEKIAAQAAEIERLRDALMRCGALAISDRADGAIPKTRALRIREISHRTCWPDDAAPLTADDLARAASDMPEKLPDVRALAGTPCPECDGRGEVAATPGHPEDGPMPCPSCGPAGTPSEDTG